MQIAEASETFGERAIAEILFGHVAGKHLARASGSGDVGLQGRQAVGVEVVGQNQSTFRGQLQHDLAADPLARARDECHAAIELTLAHRRPRSNMSHSSIPSTMMPLAAL